MRLAFLARTRAPFGQRIAESRHPFVLGRIADFAPAHVIAALLATARVESRANAMLGADLSATIVPSTPACARRPASDLAAGCAFARRAFLLHPKCPAPKWSLNVWNCSMYFSYPCSAANRSG